MKKILILFVAFISVTVNAQDVVEKMAHESCDCVSKKMNENKTMTAAQLEDEFGICVVKIYSVHSDEYNKLYNANLTDEASMRTMGEKIALKMFTYCPEILMAFAGDDESDSSESVLTIEGKVTNIKTEQFVTIQVKDKNNREHNFLLLNYFDTATLFSNNDLKKNDSVAVSYKETEIYDPKSKEFRFFKVITGLKKK